MTRRNTEKANAPVGWTPPDLKGRVAVVAGASRGAARGIALALGEAGATLYIAARTTRSGPKPYDSAPGTIEDTAEEVTRRGGRGIPVRTDCSVEADVAALFERVQKEQGRLDIMANGCWGSSQESLHMFRGVKRPFWEMQSTGWHEAMMCGAHACLCTTVHAARRMARQGGGLIAHVTEPIFEAYDRGGPLFWMFYMLGHRGINRLVEATSGELKKRKVTIVALAPGFMRTERVLLHSTEADRKRHHFDKSETTEYAGRAVASLAADSKVLAKSGKLVFVGDLAGEYGFKDADGKDVGNFFKKMKMKV